MLNGFVALQKYVGSVRRRACSWAQRPQTRLHNSKLCPLSCRETAELPADASTPVLQPLSRPPSRYSDGTNAGPSPQAVLPPMLFIDLRHATGIKPLLAATATALAPQELFLSLALTRKGGQPVPGAAWGLRSRAVLADEDKEKVRWNERHVGDLPKGNDHFFLRRGSIYDLSVGERCRHGQLLFLPHFAWIVVLDVGGNQVVLNPYEALLHRRSAV